MSDEHRQVSGRYRLTGRIGSGAMGVVWLGYDERLSRTVAVKELMLPYGLSDDEANEARQRAMREGRLAARLQHPYAIAVFDVVEDDGQPWLVMEYLESESLSAAVAERGPLPPDEVARIGTQIASALAAAHTAGIVHRDIKPGNVLLGERAAKITDFGISRAVGELTLTATGVLAGTPAYLAPEVARGEPADYRSDVFSLGATLYTAVEGVPPFGRSDNPIAMLHRVAGGDVRPPTNAGPLEPLLLRLLDVDPRRRPTMAEAARGLAALAGSSAQLLPHEPVTQPIEPPVESTRRTPLTPMVPLGPLTPTATQSPDSSESSEWPEWPEPTAAVPLARPEDRSNRRRVLVGLLAAAAIAGVAIVATLTWIDRDPGIVAGPDPTSTRQQATASESPSPEDTSPSTPAAPSTPSAPRTTAPPTTAPPTTAPPTTAPPTTAPPTTAPPTTAPATSAAQGLREYYALLPGDLEAGYARLSDRFKRDRAQTFSSYETFWAPMRSVSVSGVRQTGDNTVSARVTYVRENGESESERHTYTLVRQDGVWVIDSQRSD